MAEALSIKEGNVQETRLEEEGKACVGLLGHAMSLDFLAQRETTEGFKEESTHAEF